MDAPLEWQGSVRRKRTIPAEAISMESGLGILSWIIFGALAGWVAGSPAGTTGERYGTMEAPEASDFASGV